MIDLLKENVDRGIKQGERCVVLDGFPRNVQQLRGFEEKVRDALLEYKSVAYFNRFKKEISHYF